MATLILAFDVVNKALVSFKGSSTDLSRLRQTNYDAIVYLVQPSTTPIPGVAQYETMTGADSVGLRLGIWDNTTGTLDDSDTYKVAFNGESDWTWNSDLGGFTGRFNCRTQELAAQIGTGKSASLYFAAAYSSGGEIQAVFDHNNATNCTVLSSTDDGGNAPMSVNGNMVVFASPFAIRNPVNGALAIATVQLDGSIIWTSMIP